MTKDVKAHVSFAEDAYAVVIKITAQEYFDNRDNIASLVNNRIKDARWLLAPHRLKKAFEKK